jgi:hypothetical protein
MDNVTFIKLEVTNGLVDYAIIDNGDGSFTSMLKSTYEAQQAEQSTPMVTDEADSL